jgi:predicted ATPase/transcriptional regulator with XRE-family HTH domain
VSTIHPSDEEQQSFGEWLKQQRRRLDLTQDQLAAKCFCSVSTIRKIESDTLTPSHSLADQLASVLQIPSALQSAFHSFARGQSSLFLTHMTSATQLFSAAPPPQDALQPAAPTYYLPAPLTGLVGREREIGSGCALLRRANVRVVTLVGPPGAGKTRLSLALAEALKAEFSDGACFVPLAPVSDPALVLSAIAHALHVQESGSVPLAQRLHNFLRPKQMLLVLDNFEQIVDAAPVVGDLLAAAPQVKAIISSREALKLYGEYEFPVPPLAVPDLKYLPASDLLEMYPAVELFVQRAQAVRPSFAVDAQNAATIAQICAWLDGLPLAIEMAAAQIKWRSPAALLDQLRQQLMALTGSPRDLSPRQQTLRGAIDWSYNLLSADEQQIFVAFAIINGGCTAESVAAISAIDPLRCENLLRGLVEKSLLQCEIESNGELRYMMLQVVREYAQTRLSEQDEQAMLQARHAAFYGQLVQQSLPNLPTTQAQLLLDRLEIEHNNLRSALEWHLQADIAGGLDLAVHLGESLWEIRGYLDEGRSWLERLLAAAPAAWAVDTAHMGRSAAAWIVAARLAVNQGDLATGTLYAQRSETFALKIESDRAMRAVLRCRASISLHQGHYAHANALYEQALDLCDSEHDQREAALILNGMGLIAKDQGDYGRALTLHEKSYAFFAATGDVIGMARSMMYSSIVAYWRGEFQRSFDFAQRCIEIQSGVGDIMSVTYSQEVQGMALVRMGRADEGIRLLQQCVAAFEQMNDQLGVAVTLVDLGQATYLQQDFADALAYHRRAVTIAHTIGDRRRIAFSLDGIAMALTRLAIIHSPDLAMLERATCCFAAAETLRQTIHAPLPETERGDHDACRALLAALPHDRYLLAWERGRTLPIEQLI